MVIWFSIAHEMVGFCDVERRKFLWLLRSRHVNKHAGPCRGVTLKKVEA